MLEQMLKRLFDSDKKAASDSGSERIKADVLSRIESGKPMRKYIGIKPLIVAAVVAAVGLMSVVLTVNASVDKEVMEKISNTEQSQGTPGYRDSELSAYPPEYREAFIKRRELGYWENEIMEEYAKGKIQSVLDDGGIKVEKELDETDVVGFVAPLSSRFTSTPSERDLEFARLIEEDPEALGLTPIGKSETFVGGYRIVNRHFENKNELTDQERTCYSFRRVYTDDAENRLIASIYIGFRAKFHPYDPNQSIHYLKDHYETIYHVFLDHTEDGCIAEPEKELVSNCGSLSTGGVLDSNNMKYDVNINYWTLKPVFAEKYPEYSDGVPFGCIIAVTEDGAQWLD